MLHHLKNVGRFATTGGILRLPGKVLGAWRRGGGRELQRVFRNVWKKSGHRPVPGEVGRDRNDYREWVRRFDTLQPAQIEAMRQDVAGWPARPLISIIMPTYNTRREWLVEAIESVREQAYPHWELCIADDASTEPHVRDVLQAYMAQDPRVRVVFRETNGHISRTTNSALELATGEWVALLDHDDLLPAHSLYWIARAAIEQPQARMIYSDEDKVDETRERFAAYFKPDWNPDLFRAQNMFSHLGAFRAELVRAVGGFRVGLEGSQDYDLALRCMERVRRDQIVHIPRVLYHWRVHEESTASSNDAKPYAQIAAERALNEHLQRMGVRAHAERTPFGYRIRYELPDPAPRVGVVVIGAASCRAFGRSLSSVLSSDYPDFRVYVTAARQPLRRTAHDSRVRTVTRRGDTGELSAALRQLQADGCTIVCLLTAGAKPLGADWLRELATQCVRPEIGLVAPRLVDARGRILSGGVALLPNTQGALDLHAGYDREDPGSGGRCQLPQLCSAVRSACVAVRLEVYRAIQQGGEDLHTDGGLELSRRVLASGLDVLWTPYAEVQLKSNALPPLETSSAQQVDPAYNPNLYLAEADFSLAWPPLVTPRAAVDRTESLNGLPAQRSELSS